MINASQEFKNLVKKGVKVVNYADITLRDGTVLNLEPSDFVIGGFSMTDKTTNGKFEIGTAIAKTISVTIANHTNKFSTYDFYKSIIYMYVAVEKEDGTVLKERKGKYYVINPTTPGDIIKLSGVDSMYLFDKPYNASTSFPATLQAILSDCCLDCGVKIGFKQFDNYNFVVKNKPTDCTYRQVVSWVAQIAGYNARISNEDYLELVWYDLKNAKLFEIDGGNFLLYNQENIYDGGDFSDYNQGIILDGGLFTDLVPENIRKIKNLSVSTDDVVITGVKVEYEDVVCSYGNEGYEILVKDNQLTLGKEQVIANYLGAKFVGITFRPLSCQTVNNPFFESFDECYVYDRKGNGYFTLINNITYTVNGFTTISCNADDPVRNESSYMSESAKAVVQARRNAEKQITTYDKAVQNMNMLASNAMGLYRESETQSDGSVIYYMSNRPITKNDSGVCSFEENSVVYKMTGDGFFVSEDGGKSYTSGFDAKGNAVLNVLAVIGITFDWAKGGTLTLGGENNVNGSLVVLDSKGKQVGKWDNSGITLPPGTTISWKQITDNENVANINQIPTNNTQLENGAGYTTQIDVNSIITNKVTASFINALKVTAGSVAAENISGTTIKGKTIDGGTVKGASIEGGSIKIGTKFSVNSDGEVEASSIEITGGTIKIGKKFSVNSNGEVEANSLKSNSIEITGGKIGGFDILSSGIKNGKNSINSTSSGVYIGTDGINIGYNNAFVVTASGDVTIKGNSGLAMSQTSDIYWLSGFLKLKYDGVYLDTSMNTYFKSGLLKIGGTATYYTKIESNKITFGSGDNAEIVKGSTTMIYISNDGTTLLNNVLVGSSRGKVGFFGNSGSSKQSVSTITSTSSATTSTIALKVNELINALKDYNLV